MSGWRSLSKPAVLAMHGRLLAEHGGDTGLRDDALLESALAAPHNHDRYAEADDFLLAGVHAHALITNHPFVDGNKRIGFAAAGVFLERNGQRLTATEPDAVHAVMAVARGEMDAVAFGDWLRLASEPHTDGV